LLTYYPSTLEFVHRNIHSTPNAKRPTPNAKRSALNAKYTTPNAQPKKTMNPFLRPRRSMLYVPGCFQRFLNKARTLKVDSVIFDLGDSVLIDNKESSRNQVVEAILQGGYGRREKVVRVNDLDSPWGHDDVKAVAKIGIDAVLFPNIESSQDVHDALAALDAAGGAHLPIMVMIESIKSHRLPCHGNVRFNYPIAWS
jgi:hypothetical protein